jgi:hypothetical protein
MSSRHIEAVFTVELESPATRCTLIALAHHANHYTGQCWPSVRRIQQLTGMGESTVRKSIALLEERGLLLCARTPGRATIYTLQLEHAPFIDQHPPVAAGGVDTPPAPGGGEEPDPSGNGTNPSSSGTLIRKNIKEDASARASSERGQVPEDWKPHSKLIEWFDEHHPDLDMADQVERFVQKNRASGAVIANIEAAFKGFMGMAKSLKHPPPARRATVSDARASDGWDTKRRWEHLARTARLYRQVGRTDEALELEQQLEREQDDAIDAGNQSAPSGHAPDRGGT